MSEKQAETVTSALSSQSDEKQNTLQRRLIMQYNIARVLAESSSISSAAGQVLKMICETAGWEFGALWKVEPETHSLTNEGVWHSDYADLSDYAESIQFSMIDEDETSLPGYVIHNTLPLWFSDLSNFHSPDATLAEKAGLKSGFILPVRSGGKLIAIMECLSRTAQPREQNLIDMLNAVSNQIGIFLERKVLEETLAIRANQEHLLAETELALSASMDYEKRLMTIMHVVVPDLADWCAIDIIDQDNILRRMAAAHVDSTKEPLVYAIQPTRHVNPQDEQRPQVKILLTGQSLLYVDVPFKSIEESISDPVQLEIIRQLAPRSSIVIPLIAHERIMGICTFVQADSGRRYSSKDLVLAEDFGRRVALGLDNAILYAETQKSNSDLERRIDQRTAQLKVAINQLTDQITERQNAENQIRQLNLELEQRIAERTSQLEIANRDLQKEVVGHELATQNLRILLKRTRELYRISQSIGSVREPNELIKMLLSSSYLKKTSRASIAILDRPWIADGAPPEHCYILAEWNSGPERPKFLNHEFTLLEYGVVLPVEYGLPIIIPNILTKKKLSEPVQKRFSDLGTKSLIILPLIAGGEWYGLLSLHFGSNLIPDMDDLRHVRGLVDEMAIAIKNIRLLEAESQARLEAEAANELKLKFLAMISHELRTPLASIKGFATTLLAEDVVWQPDRQHDFLQTINSESDKLTDLIEQLLDLSRMEAGVLRISPKTQTLNEITNPVLDPLRLIASDHVLALNFSPDLPPVYADEQRIGQVLTNLVGNAAKYSPPNTKISITTQLIQDMIQVDVADEGIGIPPSQRAWVFEAFSQLESGSAVHIRGAGLGLAICKGLIEAQGGKIWIQDRSEPGTTISFTLPIAAEQNGHKVNKKRYVKG